MDDLTSAAEIAWSHRSLPVVGWRGPRASVGRKADISVAAFQKPRRTMKMVNRIGLAVALAAIVVPATLMGSTWYFIRQNPALDTCSFEGDTAIWCEEIIEVEGDSAPTTPDSFVPITAAGLESLGLQGPNQQRLAAPSTDIKIDWHESPGREWASWWIWGDCWVKGKHYTSLTGTAGHGEPTAGDMWLCAIQSISITLRESVTVGGALTMSRY